ncbi:hypothetical protein [Microbulbifer zhoushanensis]|uniref:hypothetical protein n=1 Tax=Microbulbifer zhoushanensis TaxID=2904254 RepID=UPI001F369E9D|nr:hypothetical protein [Microbulbifer zhoushanensis]
MESDKNWRLKLRYGKIETPYQHFTVIADGVAGKLAHGFQCKEGPAFMTMKTWCSDAEESAEMIQGIGADIGFTVQGRIQIYETEPAEPPRDNPFGYDISFTPYGSER